MQITHSIIETQKGPGDWFTGDVYIDAIAAPEATSTFAAAGVHFTPGARTAWHTHPLGARHLAPSPPPAQRRFPPRLQTPASTVSKPTGQPAIGIPGRRHAGGDVVASPQPGGRVEFAVAHLSPGRSGSDQADVATLAPHVCCSQQRS